MFWSYFVVDFLGCAFYTYTVLKILSANIMMLYLTCQIINGIKQKNIEDYNANNFLQYFYGNDVIILDLHHQSNIFIREYHNVTFNPLTAYPAISTGNSNVAKSAYPAISAGMCFSSFIDEFFPFIPSLST